VRAKTGLSSIKDASPSSSTSPDCSSVLAYMALAVHVSSSLGRPPDSPWRRRPGRPRGRWLGQIRRDTGQIPADHWRRGQRRGHRRGEGTLRPNDGYATTTMMMMTLAVSH